MMNQVSSFWTEGERVNPATRTHGRAASIRSTCRGIHTMEARPVRNKHHRWPTMIDPIPCVYLDMDHSRGSHDCTRAHMRWNEPVLATSCVIWRVFRALILGYLGGQEEKRGRAGRISRSVLPVI